MTTPGPILLISEEADITRDAMAAEYDAGGGAMQRLGRFWDPPSFHAAKMRMHRVGSFRLVLPQKPVFL